MSVNSEKVIGLLGGMGPEATIDIFEKIVQATSAKTDEDHVRIIIDNHPKMPSRQDAILKGAESPGPEMGRTAKNLENAGADVIIICANTAHYFYDDVKRAVDIDVLHIIDETVRETKKNNQHINKVGILATTGAMKSHIFQDSFLKQDIEVIKLPKHLQDQMQEAIFSYKYNGKNEADTEKVIEVTNYLIKEGAETVIMGCTEVPIILTDQMFDVPLIDPNKIIAKVAVQFAKGHG